jgi:hypothetical protein
MHNVNITYFSDGYRRCRDSRGQNVNTVEDTEDAEIDGATMLILLQWRILEMQR